MPSLSPVACGHPMCPAYATDKGRCDAHKIKKNKSTNEDYIERSKFYNTAKWKRIRRSVLMKEPLCRSCLSNNILVDAKIVDHIIERKHGGSDRSSNLQPLCWSCHSSKTMKDNPRKV